MRWRPDLPYDALPSPPASARLETRTVLKAATESRAALARLDQAAESMPNPSVLVSTIPLLEAQASSEIENIVTTTDALFRYAEDGSTGDAPTRETLRYLAALRAGVLTAQARGVGARTAAEVCSMIQGREMTIRDLPGTRIGNPRTREVIYSPLEGSAIIAEKLHDWERFVHERDDLDPLVKMAAAHYQFEAIHPFADGNGRTGRILNILHLLEAGLLRSPVLYLSRHLIETKSEYYARLLEVTRDDAWEPWLLYMLDGVRATCERTLGAIAETTELQARVARRSRELVRNAGDVEFQAVLFEQPYCRISTVMERCGVSRPTATKWLAALASDGLLGDHAVGRDRLFVNHAFLDVLTS